MVRIVVVDSRWQAVYNTVWFTVVSVWLGSCSA